MQLLFFPVDLSVYHLTVCCQEISDCSVLPVKISDSLKHSVLQVGTRPFSLQALDLIQKNTEKKDEDSIENWVL